MSKVASFEHGEKTIYVSDREVLAIFRSQQFENYLDIDISKMMKNEIEKFWSEDMYRLFVSLNKKINKLTCDKRILCEFEKEENGTILGSQISLKERARLKKIEEDVITDINSFLKTKRLHEIDDLIIDGVLSDTYRNFFLQNTWFEVLIYYLFKFSKIYKKEVIFNCDIIGKSGLKHQVDVTVVTPLHITVIEAKSKKFKREDLMNLIGKKVDINADVAFLITGDEYVEKKEFEDNYRNTFVLDKIFQLDFKTTLKRIEKKYYESS